MKYLTLCLWLLLLAKVIPAVAANKTTPLLDYGDRKAPALWQSLRDLEDKKRQEPIRIIQLGDSHTALYHQPALQPGITAQHRQLETERCQTTQTFRCVSSWRVYQYLGRQFDPRN